MPDMGGEVIATRVAFLELKDERRLVQEGYGLPDEILLLLAADMRRLLSHSLTLPARLSPDLRLARTARSLEECLVREYRAALEVFASDDFREGVRAAVIDKDRSPKWSPTRIEDVTPAMVAPYFAEIGADELKFP